MKLGTHLSNIPQEEINIGVKNVLFSGGAGTFYLYIIII